MPERPCLQPAVFALGGVDDVDGAVDCEQDFDGTGGGVFGGDDGPGYDFAWGCGGEGLGAGFVVGGDGDEAVVSEQGDEAGGVEAAAFDAVG